jgi:hypothetical protein
MKTTQQKARAYIAAMPREKLEQFAVDVLAVNSLEHDEENEVPVLTEDKTHNSGADFMDWIGGCLRDAGLTISEIEAFTPRAVDPAGSRTPLSSAIRGALDLIEVAKLKHSREFTALAAEYWKLRDAEKKGGAS